MSEIERLRESATKREAGLRYNLMRSHRAGEEPDEEDIAKERKFATITHVTLHDLRAALAHIDALTAERDDAKADHLRVHVEKMDFVIRATAAEAEVKRLREVLQKIGGRKDGHCVMCNHQAAIARSALGPPL